MKKITVLGLDFETQSLISKETPCPNITEIGALLEEVMIHQDKDGGEVDVWPTRKRIGQLSTLVWDSSYPPQKPEVVELTGITDAMLREPGVVPPDQGLQLLRPLMQQADIILAYNAPFDRGVYEAWEKRLGLAPLPEKEWICAMEEVPYPAQFMRCKQMGHRALDHGVKMDGRDLHRAINDCELMLDLVLGKYHLSDVLAFAREPRVILKIDIPPPWKDGGKGKDHAYALGYRWDNTAWVKKAMKKNFQLEQNIGSPYRVSALA